MDRRFGWVLSGKSQGPNARVDIDLANYECAAVVPTLGSLVPGWTLVVPRNEVLSVSALSQAERQATNEVAWDVAKRLAALPGDIYFLEHGAGAVGSDVGCGVDQAHLHVLPLKFDLLRDVLSDSEISWNEVNATAPWESVPAGTEYYYIATAARAFIGLPTVSRKQYFRRQIAKKMGIPEMWDYREWPCYENAQRTIEHFGCHSTGCKSGELRAA